MITIKEPDVAGLFYPASKEEINTSLKDLFANAKSNESLSPPKAIICPHAGYIYSGVIAASAYKQIIPIKNKIKTVIIIGPAHKLPFHGIATHTADFFRTPCGDIALNKRVYEITNILEYIKELPQAFTDEHCIEVQLPFLQSILDDFTIVPFVVGHVDYRAVAKLLGLVWGNDKTLIIISSDLSHYYDYNYANMLDKKTSNNIVNKRPEELGSDSACGRIPIQGLLKIAIDKDLTITELNLCNSGDTAGDKLKVVGYGSYHIV